MSTPVSAWLPFASKLLGGLGSGRMPAHTRGRVNGSTSLKCVRELESSHTQQDSASWSLAFVYVRMCETFCSGHWSDIAKIWISGVPSVDMDPRPAGRDHV